ncbi:MAG: hypothetical protein GY847_35240 [Proteobacteria bacterium]|nr:hypothetical protein [Pseudomonadota bacterium]
MRGIIVLITLMILARQATADVGDPELINENHAFVLSLAPTLGAVGVGGLFLGIGAAIYYNNSVNDTGPAFMIVGSSLSALGLIVGPSIGYFYARNHSRGWWDIGLRTTLTAVSALFVTIGTFCSFSGGICGSIGIPFIAVGALAFAGLVAVVVSDIAKVKRSARRANSRYRRKKTMVSFAPTLIPSSKVAAPGLAISGTW